VQLVYSSMFLFNKTHIIYDRCKHEPHLHKASDRLDALVWVARNNKFSKLPLLDNFIESRLPIIVDRMKPGDPRLEQIELGQITPTDLLSIGIEVGAIKLDHLEKFIAKKDSDEYVYSLVEIEFED
jgi:hypothetical protein